MRHRKRGRQLSRNWEKREALFRSLAMALIRHERIVTTVPKAKAVRPFVEKLITLAKRDDLAARRLAVSKLGPCADAVVSPPKKNVKKGEPTGEDARTIVQKLFSDLGPRFRDRPGGYTRIVKRHYRRLGDAGATAYLELLKDGELRHRRVKGSKAGPAPEVKADPAPAQAANESSAPESAAPESPQAEQK